MNFLPSIELVKKAEKEGYAVPSFCIWNAETIKTVLDCASEMKAPVIIMNGWAEFKLLNPEVTSEVAQELAKKHKYPIALHLDHGKSIQQIKKGLVAGYSSVMLDYSTKPFDLNVKALKKVVELAHPIGVTVEGEIGAIGRVDMTTTEGDSNSQLTKPKDAEEYVAQTGIDMLAVSIGNAHGVYTRPPNLDFDRLKEIKEVVNIPLVLHGGSSTPENHLKKAIFLGMSKINVASDLVYTIRQSLMKQWNSGENLYVPLAYAKAVKEMAGVVRRWIRLTGAERKA